MRFLLILAFVTLLGAGAALTTTIAGMNQTIETQKKELALCQAPKLAAMHCQHYMDNLAADQSVTDFCIRMTYRDKEK